MYMNTVNSGLKVGLSVLLLCNSFVRGPLGGSETCSPIKIIKSVRLGLVYECNYSEYLSAPAQQNTDYFLISFILLQYRSEIRYILRLCFDCGSASYEPRSKRGATAV